MVIRSIEASSFTDDDFALDVIRETGPGGQYITQKHTLAHCRTVPYLSGLFTRTTVDLQDEATRLTENVANALAKLENQYRCPCLPEEVLKRIDAYIISQGVPEHVLSAVAKASHAM